MSPDVPRLTPGSRSGLRVVAVALIAVGALMVVGGFVSFANGSMLGGPPVGSMAVFMLGSFAVAGGMALARLAFAGAVAGVLATETEGAVQVAAGAVGRGLRQAEGAGPVVKVRCRSCGYLESEDAKYCSRCRAEI